MAAWISDQIYVNRRFDLELNNMELIWIEIRFKFFLILVGIVYRPPSADVELWDLFQNNYMDVLERNFKYKLKLILDLY